VAELHEFFEGGRIELRTDLLEVVVDGRFYQVPMLPMAYLAALLRARGAAVTIDRLKHIAEQHRFHRRLDAIHHTDNSLRMTIFNLKKHVAGSPLRITNERGVGYRLHLEPAAAVARAA